MKGLGPHRGPAVGGGACIQWQWQVGPTTLGLCGESHPSLWGAEPRTAAAALTPTS